MHVPALPESAHDMQPPVQAVWQQTPWAQVSPVSQSAVAAQTAPAGFLPHEPLTQNEPPAQSASAPQVVRQAIIPGPQRNGAHDVSGGIAQVPAPSQVAAAVSVVPAPVEGQLGPRQGVPCAWRWHAPASQRPFVPQVVVAMLTQIPAGSADPVATLVHAPMVRGRAHDRQAPVHAVAQHTPWAQTVDTHSVPAMQGNRST